MKSVQYLIGELKSIPIGKTQIINDIRDGNHGLEAMKIGNSYGIEDDIAKKYILTRKKLHAQKELKKKKLQNI